MTFHQMILRLSLCVLAAIVGLIIGFIGVLLTFQNQFRQLETVKSFLILVFVVGSLYLVVKQRLAKGKPNQEL